MASTFKAEREARKAEIWKALLAQHGRRGERPKLRTSALADLQSETRMTY